MEILLSNKCLYIHPYGKYKGEQCERYNSCGDYCISHKEFKHGRCTAVLEQGENKGQQCPRPCKEGSKVCGKHFKFEKLFELEKSGKFKCYTHRCIEEVIMPKTYCLKCKDKKKKIKKCKAIITQGKRKGKQCINKAKGEYCDKHLEYNTLLAVAKVRNMNICGKGLRCHNLVPIHKLFCDDCSEKRKVSERARFEARVADISRCYDCGKVPEIFATTLYGLKSRYCADCYAKMRKIEERRDRSIKNESLCNPELYYDRYKYDAERRGGLYLNLTMQNSCL